MGQNFMLKCQTHLFVPSLAPVLALVHQQDQLVKIISANS